MEYRVISIGTLAAHPLWGEETDVRTGHATTTLVSAGDTHVLVDPSLPPAALVARLQERTPVGPADVTHVFLTSADSLHRRALAAFEGAAWLAFETELEAAARVVLDRLEDARGGDDAELATRLEGELKILRRCRVAPDRIAPGIDLFPLPGVTPGCCGLLLSLPRVTVLAAGDAVATREHLEQGKVLPDCFDVEQARESFAEAVQIADLLIPGRDNLVPNPLRQPFGV